MTPDQRSSSLTFATQLQATYRPYYDEVAFLSTVEPNLEDRPVVLLFVVDASHSMRFFIDEGKTVQRQTLVQTAISMALNNPSVVRDGDYIGLATFSTEVKDLLPERVVEVTPASREALERVVVDVLKSDGGQTNYGKALQHTIELFNYVEDQLGSSSAHLTGPTLVWFLTDGRPWPAEGDNTPESILRLAEQLGETGNELWLIGITNEAQQDFLHEVAMASQRGVGNHYQSLRDVPQELSQQRMAQQQSLFLDLSAETHEHLVYGLVNAIESARANMGVVAEAEFWFLTDFPEKLRFHSGVTYLDRPTDRLTRVVLKRPTTLRVGQRLLLTFAFHVDQSLLPHVRLLKIVHRYYRGESASFKTVEQLVDQPLSTLVRHDQTKTYGANRVRRSLREMREQFQNMAATVTDLTGVVEAVVGEVPPGLLGRSKMFGQMMARQDGLAIAPEERRVGQ